MGTSPDSTESTLLLDEPEADVVPFSDRAGFDPDANYLRFGSDSQAFYTVPVGDREADVLLARPHALTQRNHYAFDQVLSQLHVKLAELVKSITEYEDQRHVRPDVRVFIPGTYLTTSGERLSKKEIPQYRVTFKYGSHFEEVTFDSTLTDMHTVQRAVQRLLNTVRLSVAKSLPKAETAQSPDRAILQSEAM